MTFSTGWQRLPRGPVHPGVIDALRRIEEALGRMDREASRSTDTITAVGLDGTQAANTILAGPSSGSAAAPTFRAMAVADLPNSGVTAGSYGSASSVPVISINAKGQVTGASATPISVDASAISSGLLALSRGGTNANLSATGGAGQVLKQASAGAAITVGTLAASEIASPAALTKTDDTNVTLTLGGSPTTALLAATSITVGWAGQLGLSRGGTNANLTASNGGIVYSTASALAVLAGTATAGQMLRSGASAAPAWSAATYPATTTANQILYSSAADTVAGLTSANSGVLVTSATGVPSIGTDIPTAVTIGGAYVYRVGGTDVAVADGGTGASTATAGFNNLSPLTTLGDIIYGGTSGAGTRLAGNTTTTRKFLRQFGDGVNSAAPAWDTLNASDIPDISATYVNTGRAVNTTSPLTGGGNLAADRTIGIGGLTNVGTGNYVVGVNALATGWEYKSITGTANQIAISHSAGAITLGIAATYPGQTSITTLGTITAGTWNAGAVTSSGSIKATSGSECIVEAGGGAGSWSIQSGGTYLLFNQTGVANRMLMSASALAPFSSGGLTLGTASLPWGAAYVASLTASGGISGTTGTFSGAIQGASVTATTSDSTAYSSGYAPPIAAVKNTYDAGYGTAALLQFYTGYTSGAWLIGGATVNGGGAYSDAFILSARTGTSTYAERMRLSQVGDLLLGTTTAPSAGSGKVLVFGNNAAQPTMGTDTAGLYGYDPGTGTVEMWAVDEAGNDTQISPHDPETGEWYFFSRNRRTGKVLRVDLERFFREQFPQYLEEWTELGSVRHRPRLFSLPRLKAV